jgi:hypothetical protein
VTRAALPGGDSKPWFRQFWPWFLIILPATVVVASLFTMYIAYYGADDLVVDEYYKNGLAINRQLEKKQLSTALGISASLNFSDTHVTARVAGPVNAKTLDLLLSHPLESDRDFSVQLTRIAPGLYQALLPSSVAPRWHWTLSPDQADGWRLDGKIDQHDIGNVALE